MIKVGICGLGIVGSAMLNGFNSSNQIVGYDKFKHIGNFDDLLKTDILFLALPTVLDEQTKNYDLGPLIETCEKLQDYKNPIVIKSTVLPGTTESLALKYGLNLIHNPEFLTARTAEQDFNNQTHIVLGKTTKCSEFNYNTVIGFYKSNYPNSEISCCSSQESEMMKLALNSFYATKVQFFNELYALTDSLNMDYNGVKKLMLKNGWINPMHTNVPGPDGKFSYGGMCFPKDTNALLTFMKEQNTPCDLLNGVITSRNKMRDD